MPDEYFKMKDVLQGALQGVGSLSRDDLRGRIDSLLGAEVAWESDVFPEGLVNDREGILGFVDEVKIGFPQFDLQVVATYQSESPNEIAFEAVFSGRNEGFLANAGVRGREVKLPVSGVAVFDGSQRVVRLRTTWNCAYLMAQLGIRAHMRADPQPIAAAQA